MSGSPSLSRSRLMETTRFPSGMARLAAACGPATTIRASRSLAVTRSSSRRSWNSLRSNDAAANLAIPEGKRVVSIRRLLEREGEPLIYHRESLLYDPERPIVEAELSVTALRDMFEGGA